MARGKSASGRAKASGATGKAHHRWAKRTHMGAAADLETREPGGCFGVHRPQVKTLAALLAQPHRGLPEQQVMGGVAPAVRAAPADMVAGGWRMPQDQQGGDGLPLQLRQKQTRGDGM